MIRDFVQDVRTVNINDMNTNTIGQIMDYIDEINGLRIEKNQGKFERLLENENFLNKMNNFLVFHKESISDRDYSIYQNILNSFYDLRSLLYTHVKSTNDIVLSHNDLHFSNLLIDS